MPERRVDRRHGRRKLVRLTKNFPMSLRRSKPRSQRGIQKSISSTRPTGNRGTGDARREATSAKYPLVWRPSNALGRAFHAGLSVRTLRPQIGLTIQSNRCKRHGHSLVRAHGRKHPAHSACALRFQKRASDVRGGSLATVRRIEGTLIGPPVRSRELVEASRQWKKAPSYVGVTRPVRPKHGRSSTATHTRSPRSEMPPLLEMELATTISLALRVRLERVSASDRTTRGREFTSRRACDGHCTSTGTSNHTASNEHTSSLPSASGTSLKRGRQRYSGERIHD